MNTKFDYYVSSLLTQLNEQDTNINPNVVNSFKDVLTPMAANQNVDAGKNPSVNRDRLNAAIAAGVIAQQPDGTHAVTDTAISHIDPSDPDIGGKFTPTQQAAPAVATAAPATPAPASNNAAQPTQQQNNPPTNSSTNNAGVVSSVYSPNKR